MPPRPIGAGIDSDNFDPSTGFAFASCGDGTITVVHEDSPDKFTVVDTPIKTQQGARTMTLDTANHNIYTVTAEMMPAPLGDSGKSAPAARDQFLPDITFMLLIYSRSPPCGRWRACRGATAGAPASTASIFANPAPSL